MVREVVVYPDRRLKLVSKDVVEFDAGLHTLLDDMYDTMCAKNGVGLASIQIGVDKRILIINIPLEIEDETKSQPKNNTLEMINPIIVESRGEKKFQEGCLSVPGVYEDIDRPEYIRVKYFDRYGKDHEIEDNEFLSTAIQHEIDHLNGKIFIEKLSYIKRKKFEKEWKRKKKI